MVRMQIVMASTQVTLLDVLIAITRAEAAQRAGVPAEAERWYAEARDRAAAARRRPVPPRAGGDERGEEGRGGRGTRPAGDQVADDLQFQLWVQIGDVERAAAALARLQAAGAPLSDWHSRLSIAELRLAQGDAAAALEELRQAADAFSGSVGTLLRDPDRLDACDQPDVAALFSLRARASLALGDVTGSLVAAEEARQLVAREREAAEDESGWSEWQRAAAEYAAVSNTVLARLAAAAPDDEAAAEFAALDAADRRLAEAEHALDGPAPRHPAEACGSATPSFDPRLYKLACQRARCAWSSSPPATTSSAGRSPATWSCRRASRSATATSA